jgi:uncharacterized repeat protein (TIGR03833 family)
LVCKNVISWQPDNFPNTTTINDKTAETEKMMDGKKRINIKVGAQVSIVLKQDQSSGELTEGVVEKILTNSPNHPHGIKVRLENGDVGRVKQIS